MNWGVLSLGVAVVVAAVLVLIILTQQVPAAVLYVVGTISAAAAALAALVALKGRAEAAEDGMRQFVERAAKERTRAEAAEAKLAEADHRFDPMSDRVIVTGEGWRALKTQAARAEAAEAKLAAVQATLEHDGFDCPACLDPSPNAPHDISDRSCVYGPNSRTATEAKLAEAERERDHYRGAGELLVGAEERAQALEKALAWGLENLSDDCSEWKDIARAALAREEGP